MAVAEKESLPAQREILAVVSREAIEHKSRSQFVVLTTPVVSGEVSPEAGGAVHFRIGERFVASVVPAQAGKSAQRGAQLLLGIQANTVFRSTETASGFNVRSRGAVCQKIADRLSIAAQVGNVAIREQANSAAAIRQQTGTHFQFEVVHTRPG